MPRRQPVRAVAQPVKDQAADLIARQRRAKRHVDDLERSNYTEPSASATGKARFVTIADDNADDNQLIRDENNAAAAKKRKKQSNAVRILLMYRKKLPELIKESGLEKLDPYVPTYLTAAAPPPRTPAIRLCEICGYLGKYRCDRCGAYCCTMPCQVAHDETRCERR